jgi:hypothetical protein
MRAWTAVFTLTVLLIASQASYGAKGGGHIGRSSGSSGSAGRSSGSVEKPVHVNGYTKMNGTVVQPYNRSLPGSGSGKSRSSKSSHSNASSTLADDAFGPALTPKGLSPKTLGPVVTPTTTSPSTSTTSTATQPTSSASANNTPTTTTIRFVSGFPFFVTVPWTLDPEAVARHNYGPLVNNARNLIRAGIYPQAVNLLQRVIGAVPGTRVATEAQRLLDTIPAG